MKTEAVRHGKLIFDYWLANGNNHKDYDIIDGDLVYLPTAETLCTEHEFQQFVEGFEIARQ